MLGVVGLLLLLLLLLIERLFYAHLLRTFVKLLPMER